MILFIPYCLIGEYSVLLPTGIIKNRTGHPANGKLAQAGVSFRVCANAMKKVPITKEDLLPCVEVVPAGVVEIVRLQREDFAYIKP